MGFRLTDYDGEEIGIGAEPDANGEKLLARAFEAERGGAFALAQVYRDAAADAFDIMERAAASARTFAGNPGHGGTL